jgi:hypothetical protein
LWFTGATTLHAFAEEAKQPVEASFISFITIDDTGDSESGIAADLALALDHRDTTIEFKASVNRAFASPADTSANVEANIKIELTKHAITTFDFAYAYDRDYDANFSPLISTIETTHEPTATFGIEWRGDAIRVNADVESSLLINDDIERIGFENFNQSVKDYLASEAALRLTFTTDTGFLPFTEIAYVDRRYLNSGSRDFAGPEIIAGVEMTRPELTGQAAAIVSWRKHDGKTLVAFGPYIEIVWSEPPTEFTLTLASTIDQNEGGDPALFRVHSGSFKVEHQIDDSTKISGKLDAALEDKRGDNDTVTLTPEIQFERMLTRNLTLFGTASLEWEKPLGDPAAMTANVRFGLKFDLSH